MEYARSTEDAESERAALEAIVGAHFMLERASRWTVRSLQAVVLPSFLLWLHSRRSLPGLVTWLGELAWTSCAVLTVVFSVATVKWGRALEEELPATRRRTRLRFALSGLAPSISSFLLLIALVASAGLFAHAALPHTFSAETLTVFQGSWLCLSLAGVGARGIELVA